MDKQNIDEQFILDLRRDVDELRANMEELAKFMITLDDKGAKLTDYTYTYVKRFGNHIDTLYDMVAPLEQKFFPEVNKARGKFEEIRDDIASGKGDDQLKE